MKLFSRNKEPVDPAIIISRCLRSLANRITEDLESESYHWNKPWGVKKFESMVLAKFILDYSFEGVVGDQLSDEEKTGYYDLSNTSFSSMFNEEFSEISLNYEDMQEEIENKVEAYFAARREHKRPPECWYQIYMLTTRSQSREELEEEVKKKIAGLELMQNNENFAPMVPQYEARIKVLKDKASAFDLAEMMLPHMVRFAKQKLKTIKLKKIKAISKKLAKKDKK